MSENRSDNGNGAVGSVYSANQFAQAIGVSRRTLYSWDKKGLLVAHRYPSGRPFYTEKQLASVLARQTESTPLQE